jgi:hypothetical protein
MANELYRDHLLVWKAIYDQETDAWFGEGHISWKVIDKYQFHRLEGPRRLFEEEALTLWKEMAERWVDRKL